MMAQNDGTVTCENQIRSCIPENYTYLFDTSTCKFQSKDNFAATFRIQEVTDKIKAKKWLEDLSQCSYVTWRCQVQPRCKLKNVFKSYMKCQHRSSSKPLKNFRISKNTNCDASLSLIVRRTKFDRFSRSADPDPLLMDWPCIVVLSNIHNHKINSAEILRFRSMSLNTRTRLLDMFNIGHSPSSAFHTLETDLCLENPDACQDGAYLPTVARITHYFNPKFKARFKSKSVQDIVLESEKLLINWGQTTGGKYVIGTTNDNRYFVALCTPLMQRVHELIAQSADIVYLEAIGGLDRHRHRVYFLIVATAAGGLPLGVIITNSKTGEILTSAINDLQGVCFPTGAFHFSGSPKIIVMDKLQELNILQYHFPSSTILVNSFYLLQDAWCWLSDRNRNKVPEADRNVLYYLLKAVVTCRSEAQLQASYKELHEHPLCSMHHTFKTYVTRLWESRKEWASCYQPDLPIVGYNLFNCSAIAFRILRDVLFLRTMAFQLTPLVDFVINQYEKYIEKTLLLYMAQEEGKCLLSMLLPCTMNVKTEDICPHPTAEGIFLVPCSGAEETVTYSVDAADMTCSCLGGCGTKMCKHASAVLQKLVVESTKFSNPSTIIAKDTAIEVAKGGSSSTNAIPIVNKNDENENFSSLVLFSAEGGEVAQLVESNQTISGAPFAFDNLTVEPETSLIQYAMSNGLFEANVMLKLATEETESYDTPSGEMVPGNFSLKEPASSSVPSGESLSYEVPAREFNPPSQMACEDKTVTVSTYTLMLSTEPSGSLHNLENPAHVDMANISVYLMDTDTDGQHLIHSPIIGESTITDSVFTRFTDSSESPAVTVDSSPNSPKINPMRSKVETVEMSPVMSEYSISDVGAITEIVIPNQNNFVSNVSEDCEMFSDTEEKFNILIERIKESKKTNPAVFQAAIRKMVINAETYANTEVKLAEALASFAEPRS